MRNRAPFAVLVAGLVALGVALVLSSFTPAVAQSGSSSKVQGLSLAGTANASSICPVVIGYVDTATNTVMFAVSDLLGQRVHGVQTNGGSVTNVRPIEIGGSDGANLRAVATDTSGRVYVIAAVDSGGTGRRPLSTSSGVLFHGEAISPTDSITPVYVTSNGTTNQTILGALGGETIYVAELLFKNASASVTHAVTVRSSSGSVVAAFTVSASGTGVLGGNGLAGFYRTFRGDGLTFTIDGAGSSTDVLVTGVVVQK